MSIYTLTILRRSGGEKVCGRCGGICSKVGDTGRLQRRREQKYVNNCRVPWSKKWYTSSRNAHQVVDVHHFLDQRTLQLLTYMFLSVERYVLVSTTHAPCQSNAPRICMCQGFANYANTTTFFLVVKWKIGRNYSLYCLEGLLFICIIAVHVHHFMTVIHLPIPTKACLHSHYNTTVDENVNKQQR